MMEQHSEKNLLVKNFEKIKKRFVPNQDYSILLTE